MLLLLLAVARGYAQQGNEQGSTQSGYGNNIISITPFAYNNKAFSYGFSYERFLSPNGKWSLYIPVLYNTRPAEYHYRDKYSEKNLGVYLGFKYYTAGSHAPVRYALGGMIGHLNTNKHVVETYYPGPGGNRTQDTRYTTSLTGFMFHNSLNVFLFKKFTYSMELDMGIAGQSGNFNNEYGDGTLPFVLFQMSLGYRF